MNDVVSVYVGTYAKYNNGSLFGEWVDINKFDCHKEFHSYCVKLHDDETDPELMYQDHEGLPGDDCGNINGYLWQWLALDQTSRDVVCAYMYCFDCNLTVAFQNYADAYIGQFDSMEEFSHDHFIEWHQIPNTLIDYIDYNKVDIEYELEYYINNGHVFRNHHG